MVVLILILFSFLSPSCGYDSLDPYGNVTIKWDLMQSDSVTHSVRVSLFNYYLYHHVNEPGWKLHWMWKGSEVIWGMRGAEATEQGDCSAFKTAKLPHCCEKRPTIVDLLPGAPYNMQSQNCCKGGVLSSMTQDPSKYGATFEMDVGGDESYYSSFVMPSEISLAVPGYTCGNAVKVPSSKFSVGTGRRRTQALSTWNVTCMYSQFAASAAPKCCVSLSAFYNDTIVPCPLCSCGCAAQSAQRCVNPSWLLFESSRPDETPLLRKTPDPNEEPTPMVRCSQYMCPIKVHWHVKQSYKEYWRVKITIDNLNVIKNYSQWNLVVVHPNLQSLTQVFSFNYKPLDQYSYINDSGMFWGIQYYNDMLLQSGENGNVQSELLLHKDEGIFTFKGGWAFPRRILFNGDECVMPLPEDYPRLPNGSYSSSLRTFMILLPLLVLISVTL